MELLSLLFLYLFIITVTSFRQLLFGHHRTSPAVRKFAKCEQTVGDDEISQLPSDILIRIISFLPVREAAKTTILSRYWNGLWLLAPNLDFATSHESKQLVTHPQILFRLRREYVEWVNRVLQSHKAVAIGDFRIQFDLDCSSREDIDKWLSYAFSKGVQRMELDLLKNEFDGWYYRAIGPYCFPDWLLYQSNAFLIRSLSLRGVCVTQDNVYLFLHKFPFLDSLKVQESGGLYSVEVCGPSLVLKHLEIMRCKYLDSIIVCDAYCLVSLRIVKVRHLVVKNVPKLVNVLIAEAGYRRPLREMLPKLSTCLSTLEVLSLHISSYDVNQAKLTEVPQLAELKRLNLCVREVGDESLICLTSLITSSPKLEKLVLDLEWYHEPSGLERELERGPRLPLQHLKVIEYRGYRGCTADDELVEYLLENAMALEKVTVTLHKVGSPGIWDKIRHKRQVRKLEQMMPSSVKLVIQLAHSVERLGPCC